jgi:peptidyl-prolyl cis-trans isomerase B (cyclophilin B)
MKQLIKKVFILIFLSLVIASCSDTKVQETLNEDINTETNLTTNNENIMNNSIQTQGLQEGDIAAVMKTTNGTITLKLFTNLVPKTTTNFIALAKKGYYNDVIFHRVIKWFMIQWGDPEGTWMGWESIYGEKFDDEFTPELTNIKYSISMANAWANTNWSQFFINEANNNFLDNKHSVFGQVVDWTGTVDKIEKVKTDTNDKPEKEVKIISIDIKEYKNWVLKDYDFDLDSTLKEAEEAKKQEQEAKKTKAIEAWDTVEAHYTWTFDGWEKFDSSLDRGEPIAFQVWVGQMIKWFDDAVVWMKIWDKKTIRLEPKDAYWELEVSVPKADLQSFVDAGVKLEAWEVLPTSGWELKILSANDDSITIENTHPMAWKTLNFDIEIVNIK